MSNPFGTNSTQRGGGIDIEDLPYGVRLAAAWSWRLVAIVAAVGLVVAGLRVISAIVVPLSVAVLLSVLLRPIVRLLVTHTPLNRALSSVITVIGLIVFVVGMVSLSGVQLATGAGDLTGNLQQGLDSVQNWLKTGPLQLTGEQLAAYLEQARQAVSANSSVITTGALAAGVTAVDFLAGSLITLIATFFYLYEGEKIWAFLIRLLPRAAQVPTYQAARRGWVSLGSYARTQVLVAGVDAIGIGLGALILGLPFVIPITLLVFFASFVPIVGAIVSGVVPILIALVVKGPVFALIMLGIVLLVQQVEAHALQPFLMGRAVALHPLAVICAVALGSYLLGIVGALFAVPFLALANSVVRYLVGDDPFPDLGTGRGRLDGDEVVESPIGAGLATAEGGEAVPS